MMNSIKILTVPLTLAVMSGSTLAQSSQSKRYYDSSGRSVGTSSADSQGTTTFYDARGKVIDRQSTSGNGTTVYDASGRKVGRFTTSR
ncbi:hypothetical protein JQ625_28285 [Bradyrhizobium diazoefficiens]|nr:hypothetical protein [Bradyrhizobium diazoefficiens]MBR0778744.1 hypothetical protein [Bradyrhizobium diazoefficiens]